MNTSETKPSGNNKRRTSWKSIYGGDFLANGFFGRQLKLMVLLVILIIFYIQNRYASEMQLLEIDHLKQELIDTKYDALTRNSELMMKSRQSLIEDYVSEKGSDIKIATQPPYKIPN